MKLWLILLLSVPCFGMLRADLNGDCRVDMADLYILISEWMLQENCEMSLGPELVVNGDFETGDFTGWETPDASWFISGLIGGGPAEWRATCDTFGGETVAEPLKQLLQFQPGKTYRISYDIVEAILNPDLPDYFGAVLGFILEGWGGTGGEVHTEVGTYSENFLVPDDYEYTEGDGIVIGMTSWWPLCQFSFDNVSVREILEDSGGLSGAEYLQGMMDEER